MFGLLLENLKLYKIQYLYNILTLIFLMFIMIEFKLGDVSFLQIMIIILIFIPETIRINNILKDGYLKLLNKLPISYNDLYRHKLLVSSSGMILNILLLIAINIFVKLPQEFFDNVNLFVSILFMGIIIQNSTNIYNSPRKFVSVKYDIINLAGIFIMVLSLGGIYKSVSKIDINIYGNINNTYNYLLCLILQLIFLYYYGKLYYLIRNKKFRYFYY